ncbi:MAG: hypothetical protein AOA65_1476 [Candidatus Bathyarchaeota archaeon BA1]|nr:MAG: hypothetical protein AOA65_1476 [Candidatus Bathyarchaeota archaeon BA1]
MSRAKFLFEFKNRLRLLCALLGLIGMACVLLIGSYIISFCWLVHGLGSQFLWMAVIVWILAFISTLSLGYGSYKMIKGFMLMGGLANTVAGVASFGIFYYFYFLFPLLNQFDPLGFLLFAPALISGILGLAVSRIAEPPRRRRRTRRPRAKT